MPFTFDVRLATCLPGTRKQPFIGCQALPDLFVQEHQMQLQQASDGAAPEAAPDAQSSTAAGRSGRGSRAVDDFLALAPDEVAAACCPLHHIA